MDSKWAYSVKSVCVYGCRIYANQSSEVVVDPDRLGIFQQVCLST